jgi:hypothetical protein
MMKSYVYKIFLLLGLLATVYAEARPPEEAEFIAASHLAEDIAQWIDQIEFRPNSVGIFAIHSNAPLEQDFSNLLENEIIKYLNQKSFEKVISCLECRNPTVTVQDNKVIIARGTPDLEQMKRAGKAQSVEAFLMVEVYRTNLSVYAQSTLYENPSGKLMGSERFRAAALNFKDASVQVILEVGAGKALSGGSASATSTDAGWLTSANLLLLEELGFAKGGLDAGGVFGNASLFYLNPTLAFRGRFGASMMSYGLHLGVGYGMSSGTKGIALRGSYELFLGTLAMIGTELDYFLPDKSGTNALTGFWGFHVGISLGR